MKQQFFEQVAATRLEGSNFKSQSIEDLALPEVQRADHVSGPLVFIEMGNTKDAEKVAFSLIPYSTRLDDPSIKVRLAAQQVALGKEVAVVGVQVFEPKLQPLSKSERTEVKHGSFEPFADRVLGVADHLGITDDQVSGMYGYSMGADVAVSTTRANLYDENRGIIDIGCLGVFEPVRVQQRGAVAVMAAFANSGQELFNNVVASNSTALLEANAIDLNNPKAEKQYNSRVQRGVAGYNLQDVRGNLAIVRGFANATSLIELEMISAHIEGPDTIVGRMEDSTITPATLTDDLSFIERYVDSYKGDHSTADNLTKSAAFILRTMNPR